MTAQYGQQIRRGCGFMEGALVAPEAADRSTHEQHVVRAHGEIIVESHQHLLPALDVLADELKGAD